MPQVPVSALSCLTHRVYTSARSCSRNGWASGLAPPLFDYGPFCWLVFSFPSSAFSFAPRGSLAPPTSLKTLSAWARSCPARLSLGVQRLPVPPSPCLWDEQLQGLARPSPGLSVFLFGLPELFASTSLRVKPPWLPEGREKLALACLVRLPLGVSSWLLHLRWATPLAPLSPLAARWTCPHACLSPVSLLVRTRRRLLLR